MISCNSGFVFFQLCTVASDLPMYSANALIVIIYKIIKVFFTNTITIKGVTKMQVEIKNPPLFTDSYIWNNEVLTYIQTGIKKCHSLVRAVIMFDKNNIVSRLKTKKFTSSPKWKFAVQKYNMWKCKVIFDHWYKGKV